MMVVVAVRCHALVERLWLHNHMVPLHGKPDGSVNMRAAFNGQRVHVDGESERFVCWVVRHVERLQHFHHAVVHGAVNLEQQARVRGKR